MLTLIKTESIYQQLFHPMLAYTEHRGKLIIYLNADEEQGPATKNNCVFYLYTNTVQPDKFVCCF